MVITRGLGALILLLCCYYARFYALRREPFTAAQLAVLLCAAAFVFLQERPARPRAIWFRSGRPATWQGWVAAAGSIGLLLALFVAADRGSHSASDTLQRIAPAYSLLAALVVKLWYERAGSLAP